MWFVYIVECADKSLYTGVTRDVERRLQEHNHDDKLGARYTRARRPVKLCYQETCDDRAAACKREAAIKRMTRQHKLELIKSSKA